MKKEIRTKVGSREVCFAANGPVARVMLSNTTENGNLPSDAPMTDSEKSALVSWVIELIARISTTGYCNKNGESLSRKEQRVLVEDVCDCLLGKKARADSSCENCIDRFTCNQCCNCVTLERSVH